MALKGIEMEKTFFFGRYVDAPLLILHHPIPSHPIPSSLSPTTTAMIYHHHRHHHRQRHLIIIIGGDSRSSSSSSSSSSKKTKQQLCRHIKEEEEEINNNDGRFVWSYLPYCRCFGLEYDTERKNAGSDSDLRSVQTSDESSTELPSNIATSSASSMKREDSERSNMLPTRIN